MRKQTSYDWDEAKNQENIEKHGVSFYLAQHAFTDSNRVILEDLKHSKAEKRYYCIGIVAKGILTVRFTFRKNIIRIFGAGFWRKGKKIYDQQNKIH